MNKIMLVLLLGIIGTILCTIGVGYVYTNAKLLIVAAIGFVGMLYASNEFLTIFDNCEVDDEEE